MTDNNIETFIRELDSYFAREDLTGAEACLISWKKKYISENNRKCILSVLNEMIGYYRQTKDVSKGKAAVSEAVSLVSELGIDNAVSGATILLNAATTLKSYNDLDSAMPYYFKAEAVLTEKLKADDPLLAGLYNNIALAYQDLSEYTKAEEYFIKALRITESDSRNALESAVTYVNLAHLKFDVDPLNPVSTEFMEKAADILKNPDYEGYGKYAFTCRKCAPSFGYFGMFMDEKYFNEKADRIYAGT